MAQTLEDVVLSRAIALVDCEDRWTSGAWARDADGRRCDPLSAAARQWCAVGALQVSAYRILPDRKAAARIARAIADKLAPGPGGLVYINECGDYGRVRAVMHSATSAHTLPTQAVYSRNGFAAFARAASEGGRNRATANVILHRWQQIQTT